MNHAACVQCSQARRHLAQQLHGARGWWRRRDDVIERTAFDELHHGASANTGPFAGVVSAFVSLGLPSEPIG